MHYAERSAFHVQASVDDNAVMYLVGGGIASLAAAALLIRDGDIAGHNITLLEVERWYCDYAVA